MKVRIADRPTDHDRRLWRRRAELLKKRFTTGLTPDETTERNAIGAELLQRWRERNAR